MNTELFRRMAQCGRVEIFEKRLPTGAPEYAVAIRGEVVSLIGDWPSALLLFKEQVAVQTERTLALIS